MKILINGKGLHSYKTAKAEIRKEHDEIKYQEIKEIIKEKIMIKQITCFLKETKRKSELYLRAPIIEKYYASI